MIPQLPVKTLTMRPQRFVSIGLASIVLTSAWALATAPELPVPATQHATSNIEPEPSYALSGSVRLSAGGKPLRASEAMNAVVYFKPDVAVAVQPLAQAVSVTTQRKRFLPKVLAIPLGTEVNFPNEDPILHNAFSVSPGNEFDAGLYGEGGNYTRTFDRAGVVKVYCNVHQNMVHTLLVMDTPYFVQPNAAGEYTLHGLPSGQGELYVWYDRARVYRQRLNPAEAQARIDVDLEVATGRLAPHKNKFGQPYRRARDDNY